MMGSSSTARILMSFSITTFGICRFHWARVKQNQLLGETWHKFGIFKQFEFRLIIGSTLAAF
jgi:hypothetical protein